MSEPAVEVKIGMKAFLTAVIILALLMVFAGILTLVIPAGSYDRVMADGREVINPDSFQYTPSLHYPVWRWFTAPLEVLWGPDGATVIVIILFIMAIGGSFSLLEKSGVLAALILKIVSRFEKRKYLLLSIIILLFMLMGAVLGTFEENVALVPIVIALSCFLGWDSLTGLGMSVLASCFGFAAAISNPFSVVITQKLAGLPLYSAMGYRMVIFAVFYLLVCIFLVRYARKIEKNPRLSPVYVEDAPLREKYSSRGSFAERQKEKTEVERRMLDRSIICFSFFVLLVLLVILAASVMPGLTDLAMPLIALLFLMGSIVSSIQAGLSRKTGLRTLYGGVAGMAPGILLILMAMSVKHIISRSGIMDTILFHAASLISTTPSLTAVFMVYFLILVLELFIGSSSAKAFLVMPIVAPLADLIGVTRQSAVLAFCFGDGFSNVLYPTNPVLLICLGLTVVSYPKWFRWTIRLQLFTFLLSCIFLAIAVGIKLGPF